MAIALTSPAAIQADTFQYIRIPTLPGFIQNAALLLVLGLLLDLRTRRASLRDARGSRCTFGLLLGAAGVATMIFPVRLEPGLVLDSRGLLQAISSFHFGLGPTAAPAPRRGASRSPCLASRSARCT